jgi:outer membrane protein OmpA-like peptidoglycan-associated protein
MKQFTTTLLLAFLTIFSYGQNKTTVLFDYDQFNLKSSEQAKLKELIKDKYILEVTITGYTDSDGNENYNQTLSLKRAKSVEAFFIKKGVTTTQFKSISGKGEIQSGDKAQNRRVEISIEFEKLVINTPPINEEPILEEIIEEAQEIEEAVTENLQTELDENTVTNLEVGQTLALKGLNFIPGRHFLMPNSEETLIDLIKILKNNPNLKIEVQGHICCLKSGSDGLDIDTQTMTLSVNRAQYVYNYLIENGISPYRLSYKGFAATQPLVEEITDEDKQLNRRVEIMITAK